jgi:thioredoxin-related protein
MSIKLKLRNCCTKLTLVLALIVVANMTSAQKKIKWMKFEDAVVAQQKNPRKIFVDIYADWCGWCKVLDRETFSDTGVIRIINEYYYPVKLDSESKETHQVGEHKLSSPELAASLAMVKPEEGLGLPTMVIITENMQVGEIIQGFQKANYMKDRLSFFALNKHIAAAAAVATANKSTVKWMKFEDAVTATKKEPRKIFIDIYADWCRWCKVLDQTTFADSTVARILNEQYYPVKLDAESKETQTLPDGGKVSSAELASMLAAPKPGAKYGLPVMIILNERVSPLTKIQGAQRPDFMTPALKFFGENHYLEKSWETYVKEYNQQIKP